MDHLHLRHHAGSFVKASTLGKCFPPWTVTRSAWAAVLGARVSGIATDVMLFSQHGARLVHRYRVLADSVPYQSLRGLFMTKFSAFTHQTSAVARSVAKCGRDSESPPLTLLLAQTPPTPLGPARRMPDYAPPAPGKSLARCSRF